MALFTISDLHLSFGCDKPMNVFEGWNDYEERLKSKWERLVSDGDTVVIPGDISWGMTFEEARLDFEFIESLPGSKIILKGNHDYWWSTKKKMDALLSECGIKTITILSNSSVDVEGRVICGTRSWLWEKASAADEKVLAREVGRLKMSLDSANDKNGERIAFLHYPPIYQSIKMTPIIELLNEYGVKRCFYGHMHGKSINYSVNREVDGITYKLVSADSLGFEPYRII